MDFKFKEVVEESIIYFYDHVLSCNKYTEDVFEELDHVYAQAPKADEYKAKNKELLEELKYLKKVNYDLVWQRDTDEEHEAKAKAFDAIMREWKDERMAKSHILETIQKYYDEYESGESDD